jgi:putative ABC transport system ATP-binding protein
VAVARALANHPGVILADEPTGSLDSESGARILDILSDVQERSGTTLVLVTHDETVASRAGRVIRMLDGRICS